MDGRQVRGLEIAQRGKIVRTPSGWVVPSQSGNGAYLVHKEGMRTVCDCPDCQLRRTKCKHQYAVDYFMEQVTDSEGNTTITKAVRVTYPQNWKAYTAAQTHEVALFDKLLSELVKGIPEPIQVMGRPRLSLQESVFCSIQKVYSHRTTT